MKYYLKKTSATKDMLPDNCLHIKGYLRRDYNDIIGVTEAKDSLGYQVQSIIELIEEYAARYGFLRDKHTGLGGAQSIIRNCNMRAYFTAKKCSLATAQYNLDAIMYGGDLVTDTSYTGYSEWTITGLDLDEFTIGGHDLCGEFEDHLGEYVHLIIECS